MKKIYSIIFLLMFVASVVNAADRYSVASTAWNLTATWSATSGGASGASVPVAGDNVFIEGGFTVSITVNAACANLTIGTGTSGTLSFNSTTNRTLTVSGFISIASGSTLTTANAAGANSHSVLVAGNVTNNGTLDCITSDDLINFTFNGAANQTVSGTGGTTDFNLITVNNTGATGSNIVEVSTTNFTVPAAFLTPTDGVFKVSGSFVLSNTFFTPAGYSIPAAGGLWLNNANATVTAQGSDVTLNGSLQITAGTYNVGTGTGDDMRYGSGASLTIDGGTLNVAASFSGTSSPTLETITFNMSSGTFLLSTFDNSSTSRENLEISVAGSSFTMSGGTIIIQTVGSDAAVNEWDMRAGTISITGGTLQFGNASTPAASTFEITSLSTTPNVVISSTNSPALMLNGVTTFSGNVTINTGATLNANGEDISVSGNWTNNGTFTPGTTQTVTFNGAAAQTIGGTTATAFLGLTINNTSGGVSLSQDVNVTGTMTFTSGVVTSTSTNTLIINDGAGASGASNSSYVDGPMQKLGNDDFTFPVGDPAGSYHQLRLVNTAGANGDGFTAEYFRASGAALGTVPSPLIEVSNCEYWTLTRDLGTSTPNLFVSWTAQSPCGGFPYTTSLTGLTVARLNSGVWQLANGTDQAATGSVGVGGAGTVADNGISLFGTFALGNTQPQQNPLPVKFSNIRAFEKQQGIQIEWTAYQEENLSRYSVERSADGITYNSIGEVASRNSAIETKYGFFDASPIQGVNFYRLRTIDFDSKFAYSSIVKVNLDKTVKDISLYPNPATGGYISFQGADLAKGNYIVKVYNSAGMQVMGQSFTHTGGAINQTLKLPAGIKSGMYSLQLVNGDVKLMSKTFVVQ